MSGKANTEANVYRDTLDDLFASLIVSDIAVAKALRVPEVAQIARIEKTLREYLNKRWEDQGARAIKRAAGRLKGSRKFTKTDAKRFSKSMSVGMESWATSVVPKVGSELERVYRLARLAGAKRALGRIKSPLTYDTPHIPIKKADPPEVFVIARFDLVDREAVDGLKGQQAMWIGRHYDAIVREKIDEASLLMVEQGVPRKEAGEALARSAHKILRISDPVARYVGTSSQYFEGVVANAVTTARVHGQMRSFAAAEVEEYEITNPLDERTCKVCGHMDGKRFPISDGLKTMEAELDAKKPDDVRAAHPWLSVARMTKISPKSGHTSRRDSAALSRAGFNLPPFHFRCRCTVDIV